MNKVDGELSVNKRLCVGYARMSTDMQEGSIDQQVKAIESWAGTNGFKILRWYKDEGKSGTSFLKRPAFMRLVHDTEQRADFSHVLVYDESRWGRAGNPRESTYWKLHFERFGDKVVVVNSNSKQENDIGSFVVEVVESAEASEYSKKLSRATLRGSISNAEKGFYNGGTAPYGYQRIAVDKSTGEFCRKLDFGQRANRSEEKVKLTIGDPLEVETVKRIFQYRVDGFGYRAIAQQLNIDNIPCAKRGRWKNLDQRWSMGTIKTIVENPAYRGALAYNRFPMTKKRVGETDVLGKTKLKCQAARNEYTVVEGTHEAIVSKELWEKVNSHASHTQNHNHYYRESPYLLSGLIKCSHCGFNFQGTTQTTKYNSPGWSPSKTSYYNDGGYHAKGLAVCTPLRIRKELIESFVVHSITEYIAKSNVGEKSLQILEEMLAGDDIRVSDRDRVLDALTDNSKKMSSLISIVESGAKVDAVLGRIKQLERERELLQEHLKLIDKAIPTKADRKQMADEIARVVLNFGKEFFTSSVAQQKDLIRRFVRSVVIYREEKTRAQCHIRKIPMTVEPSGLSLPFVAGAHTMWYSQSRADHLHSLGKFPSCRIRRARIR
jgi:DNA invertase Pin-like site-specific DNA recombinase